MGDAISKLKRTEHKVFVQVTDRKGEGDNGEISLILFDTDGKESCNINLSALPQPKRGRGNRFTCASNVVKFGPVSIMELYRGAEGAQGEWFVDSIEFKNLQSMETHVLPVHRWVLPNKKIRLRQFDMLLPQNDPTPEQRKEELRKKKEEYQLENRIKDFIPLLKKFPREESFSNDYMWDIAANKNHLGYAAMAPQYQAEPWDSLEDIEDIFRPPLLPTPACFDNWKSDEAFGYQRLVGCNPNQIRLCRKLPEKIRVKPGDLKNVLEGSTIEEVIENKRLFIVDYEFLKYLPCSDDRQICAPVALFYLNKYKVLTPIAIQLFPEPADDNPTFLPTDPEYTWLLAKMYFNLADASVHQSATHVGFTHLIGGAVAVATHRSLSPSHPIFKILASHFQNLLAINHFGLGFFLDENGYTDTQTTIGRTGTIEIIRRKWKDWRLDKQGCLPADLVDRGVADTDVLPNYHYRDDGLLLYTAIDSYVKKVIGPYYDSQDKIEGDYELQE